MIKFASDVQLKNPTPKETMPELKINPKFRDLIPPLSEHELAGLEEDIKHFGCYTPIIIWNDTIIDGHHRYSICSRYKLPFKTEERKFEDEEAVMIWMIDNQMGRRNVTTAAKIRLAMKKVDIFRARAEKRMKSGGYQCKGSVKHPSLDPGEGSGKVSEEIAKDAGVSRNAVEQFMYIEKHAPKELVQDLCDGKVVKDENGKSRKLTIDGVYNQTKTKQVRAETVANLESIERQEVKAIEGVYDVVVLDPPWQIVDRTGTAGYGLLEYPTMTVEEIKELELPCADDCHVFLWTTQKFLPKSFEILDHWGLEYACTFTWVKNAGPQPLGYPQYTTEFFIYAKQGKPKFIDTKQFSTALVANKGKHSEKPEEFYELLRRVTAGRRIDMFNRRNIEGFDVWGNQAKNKKEDIA